MTNDDIYHFDLQNKMACDFQNKDFLQHALENSNHFLDLVLQSLTTWAYKEEPSGRHLNTAFIHSCPSYHRRHSRHDLYHVENLGRLTQALEKAICRHARENTEWWKENEPKLKTSNLLIFRYFLIKPYSKFPENYADGISTLLTNPELLRYGHLDYELGRLMQVSYFVLPESIQLKNQQIILSLYKDDDWRELNGCVDELPIWVYRKQYYYLCGYQ
ncbi:MAG: hypothetical protein HZT40_18480 [Candidatus Thiothrix singaporensis]|uniref:Uncharacterized protein n=1 Tax=Candidatus Thiothrix singaporensis TaxID=2799669 RepID=A0A7L6AVN8_9GAMM|nr:MAG: hypothetical protein HZT40_18480 [Candidatus Thiothrix singaporensis]